MRILHVISSAGWGGGQAVALRLATAQMQAGDSPAIAAAPGGDLEERVRTAGVPFVAVSLEGRAGPLSMLKLVRILRTQGADIVHAHLNRAGLWACLAARWGGVPSVATAHGLTSALYSVGADHVVAVSGAVAEHLVRRWGPLSGRLTVIPNPIEPLDPLTRDEARRDLGLPDRIGMVLAVVGQLHPNKGQRLALRILNHLPPSTCLVLVGDGPDRAILERQVQAGGLGNRVVFAGQRRDAGRLMRAADLILVPSGHEAFSLAAAEALLCGVPVVASATGGLIDLVGPSGVLVTSRRPEDWAEAIAGALRSLGPLSEKCQAEGTRRLALHDPRRIATLYRSLYDRLETLFGKGS